MHLTENQIITWHNDESGATHDERVLHIFPETSEVWLIDAKARDALPFTRTFGELEDAIEDGTAVPLEGDCYAPRRLTETDLESKKLRKFQHRRDKAFKILEPLVTGENEFRMLFEEDRSALITARAEEIKSWPKAERVTKKIIYIYYRRYLQGGRIPNAVLPRYGNCGARRGKPRNVKKKLGRPSRITRNSRKGADGEPTQVTGANMRPDWLEKIKLGGKLFFEHRLQPSWSWAYMKTLQRFFIKDKIIENGVVKKIITPDPNKGEIFTKGQFRYHYLQHRDPKRATLKRSGPKKFNTRHREIRGRCTARGPGFLYLVDATLADIYLISRYGAHLLVGRPIIWVIIDVFSRMITGLCVRFEGEGWLGLRLTLQNTMEDKVAFCAKYGIEITEDLWPARDRPVSIGGDRGPLISKNIERFIRQFRVGVSNTPPHRPDWKGIVEKIFHEMNIRVFDWLPGAVVPDRDPSAPDYRLAAVFDIEELTMLMIEAALHHNNECLVSEDIEIDPDFLAEDLEPYPTQLYMWGARRRPGGLRKCDFDSVRRSLLSEGYASISNGQIKFRHKKSPKPLFYKCDQLSDEGLLLRNTGKKGANFNVYFDERWADEIYLMRQAGGDLLTCQLRDKDSLHKNRDWAEVVQYKNQNQLQFDKSRPREVQAQANFDRKMMKRTADAQLRAKEDRAHLAPDQSKAAFLKNVRANRQNEIARMHEEEAAEHHSGGAQEATNSASEGHSHAPSGRRHPRTPRIPDIAELRKERMGR